ncbi:imidazole glycerol phosphate synthase subunit HisH [Paracoccaceae bacterium]|nr:imidazole glycerol phosphate synthase subunit HisH [Paracoccaceae bacterium]
MNCPDAVIVNYKSGNVKAVYDVCKMLNFNVLISDNPTILKSAKKIILPGVGSFDWALENLNSSGLRSALDECVIKYEISLLGICVGMQILMERSSEGISPGLGWIKGSCNHLSELISDEKLPVPHMGWNTVETCQSSVLFNNIMDPEFYFLHSYFVEVENECHSGAVTEYGKRFTSCVNDKNIYGVQFHPEKSHQNGVKLIKNFLELE